MSAVQEALAYVSAVPSLDLGLVEQEAGELSRRSQLLLPVERDTKRAIEERMEVLKRETEISLFAEKTGLPLLSKEVLTWRNTKSVVYKAGALKSKAISIPVPRLALIDVTWEKSAITWSSEDDYYNKKQTSSQLPDDLKEIYWDVQGALQSYRALAKSDLTMWFAYTGAIPDSTREKIQKARSTHFNKVFLLCDAPLDQWKLDVSPIPAPPDPIVVGHACEELWVIDVFDPTPVEEYVALEFSSVPQLPQAV